MATDGIDASMLENLMKIFSLIGKPMGIDFFRIGYWISDEIMDTFPK